MHDSRRGLLLVIAFVFISIAACAILPAATPTPEDTGALFTQAAQTVVAGFTQTAVVLPATETASPVPPTNTLEPSVTPSLTPTDTPTATPTNTSTPTPTNTPTPTPSPTPIPCNWAQFVDDVNVPDGSIFPPNATFTKIWRIKNIGTCTWNDQYDIVFDGGDRMGPKVFDFPEGRVRPGETVDIEVELTAPDNEGRHRSYWVFESNDNQVFGIGENAEDPIWVEIKVVSAGKYEFDFIANMCLAKWRSDAGRLDCPGSKGDPDGFVILLDKPEIEIDRLENEPALWTQPVDSRDGFIQGEYPEITVEEGSHFETVVGCLNDSQKCDVIFQLNFRSDEGGLQTLWEQREVYDGNFTRVDVDLSPLAGQKVQFYLTVLANGSPKEDRAFWLVPRIVK